LTKKLSKEIIKSKVTKLYFSIDAVTEETYQKIRKNGDFNLVLNNIKYFHKLRNELKKKIPITRVSFVKSKINESEEKQFINYWIDKADFISIQAFTTPAIGYSKEKELENEYQIDNKKLKAPGPCPQPYQRLTIYHDGSVHPCCHWSGATLIVGNIFNDSVYNIWNSQKMKVLRRNINNTKTMPEECRICRKAVFGEKIGEI
jgi:radical SAM protein with 4Fe4S-binding SPASM domain